MLALFRKNSSVVAGLILLAVCFLGYSNSFWNDFMLDDHVVLFGETGVAHKPLIEIFTGYQFAFFRPAGHVFLKLSHGLFGDNPFGYHTANLLLFFLIVFLFYKITEEIFHNKSLALLASCLYAVHPVNSMLINYITANIISTFVVCLQLSFLCFIKFYENKKKLFYFLSLFCLVPGLFSHEMSVVFPLYIVCFLFFMKKQGRQEIVKLSLPFFGLIALYFVFRWYFFNLRMVVRGTSGMLPNVSVYIGIIGDFLYWYLSKLVWPKDIIFLWTGFIFNELLMVKVLKALGLLLGVVYLIFFRWKKGGNAFALAMFTAGALPIGMACFTYFPQVNPIFEPHWFYFSSFGLFLLAAQGILALKNKVDIRIWRIVCMVIVAFLMSALWENNAQWKDQETYCRYWLRINPKNLTPYHGLGEALLKQGNYAEAKKYLLKGPEVVHYNNYFVASDLGYAYFLEGDLETARRYYQQALSMNPGYSKTHYYLGLFYLHEKDYVMAHKGFSMARKIYPENKQYERYFKTAERKLNYGKF